MEARTHVLPGHSWGALARPASARFPQNKRRATPRLNPTLKDKTCLEPCRWQGFLVSGFCFVLTVLIT